MAALDHVFQPVFHIVAQIVEAELVVGAVSNVGVVGELTLLVVQAVDNNADAKAEEIVDLAHPFGIAPGQVVVDGHHVHATPGERIEIDRQRRHQRLAFAGLHLGNAPLVQNHPTHKLHVEMTLTQRSLCRLAAGCKCRRQDVVQRGTVGNLLLERIRPGSQCLIRERFELLLQLVDLRNARQIALDAPLIGRTKQLAGDSSNHAVSP